MKALKTSDTIGLGFMILAFFLGAGNWIFPPMAGYQAGEQVFPATFGFLITAVGLPLLGIIALAYARGGLSALGRYLPSGVSMLLALAIYLIMVPGFGIPRTALVSFELAVKPFSENPNSAVLLAVFSAVYFAAVFAIARNPGRLLDTVGKFIAPLMLLLVLVLGVDVLLSPLGEIVQGEGKFAESPVINGFLEGYMTMDLLAAMLFGVLLINALKSKGVSDRDEQFKALFIGGIIAAVGLALVYFILFYMGAISGSVAEGAANGGEIFARYMAASMGAPGQWILALVITLACLTTGVGGTCAFAEYLEERFEKVAYQPALAVIVVVCWAMANIGLDDLIQLYIPVLVAIYPIAISVVILNVLADKLPSPTLSFRLVVAVAAIFGLFDALSVAGVLASIPGHGLLSSIPLFDQGMGWLIPSVLALIVSALVSRSNTEQQTPSI
ncbi:branched-chain amino acid transport system II carrier protein [Echinimonas agarilytica]|uniref:Branched-chain amino acid transport system carrier protein n=1 Tax=Echinimonas agarilytica TaxID=1215918 RepID=A0AA42B8T6_9GAMM|nr:branched-chain amino acid transport system II carrier protein [Echinimonas agarilytica]MCM2681339.1 branched-chain amino acid transport system II carrier protein [Echinimonas agarilytica]